MRDSDQRLENSPGHEAWDGKSRRRHMSWPAGACAAFMLCAATAIVAPAQTFTTLFSFDNVHGSAPSGGLVQGTDGNLYGTTARGGTHLCLFAYEGCGTMFRTTPAGTVTRLYSFCKLNDCADGGEPVAALVQGMDGDFYGTTSVGGANCEPYDGCGTVFRITPNGTLRTLYSFCSQSGCADGYEPEGALVEGSDGNFYGTTLYGGNYDNDFCPYNGCGTIFKITPNGVLTTLYSFCSRAICTDGYYPQGALVEDADGNFNGTTQNGGVNNAGYGGYGTVFRVTPTGALTTLYSFCSQASCTDGDHPFAGLTLGIDGNLYGTTDDGGNLNDCNGGGCGTVFKITSSGVLTTLSAFDYLDGAYPRAVLIQATDGNFYGTTFGGGESPNCPEDGCGTAFEITPSGTLTNLHNFCSQTGCTDGGSPAGNLAQDTNGKLYGATALGGTSTACSGSGCGTVFSLSVGLGAFVETQPAAAPVGKGVNILGSSLAGATSVTFNGTAASFTVESSSLIRTTVPTGATTGTVQVVTPGGTLNSNVPFRVLP